MSGLGERDERVDWEQVENRVEQLGHNRIQSPWWVETQFGRVSGTRLVGYCDVVTI